MVRHRSRSRNKSRKNVMLIGMPGVGKSKFLNDQFGSNFAAVRSSKGTTQKPQSLQTLWQGMPVTVWDTAGAFDPDRDVKTWCDDLKAAAGTTRFHQMIFMVNATCKATATDVMLAIALRVIMKAFNFEDGVTTIFTHCDAATNAFEEQWRKEWVEDLNFKCKFQAKGLTGFSPNKTLAFVPKSVLAGAGPAAKGAAAAVYNVSASDTDAIHKKITEKAGDMVIQAIETVTPEAVPEVGMAVAKEIWAQGKEIIGEEAVQEIMGDAPCFPADALVMVENRGWVMMQDIIVGDSLLTDGGQFTKVTAWLHRDPNQWSSWCCITHDKGVLKASCDHLVFVPGNQCTLVGNLKVGDSLLDLNGDSVAVTDVHVETSKGVYCPLTATGHFLANNVKVSCYAAWQLTGAIGTRLSFLNTCFQSHNVLHVLFTCMRKASLLSTESGQSRPVFTCAAPSVVNFGRRCGMHPTGCGSLQRTNMDDNYFLQLDLFTKLVTTGPVKQMNAGDAVTQIKQC